MEPPLAQAKESDAIPVKVGRFKMPNFASQASRKMLNYNMLTSSLMLLCKAAL
jgi:hypothetical protein